jgi:hypothetical protein
MQRGQALPLLQGLLSDFSRAMNSCIAEEGSLARIRQLRFALGRHEPLVTSCFNGHSINIHMTIAFLKHIMRLDIRTYKVDKMPGRMGESTWRARDCNAAPLSAHHSRAAIAFWLLGW